MNLKYSLCENWLTKGLLCSTFTFFSSQVRVLQSQITALFQANYIEQVHHYPVLNITHVYLPPSFSQGCFKPRAPRERAEGTRGNRGSRRMWMEGKNRQEAKQRGAAERKTLWWDLQSYKKLPIKINYANYFLLNIRPAFSVLKTEVIHLKSRDQKRKHPLNDDQDFCWLNILPYDCLLLCVMASLY